MWGGCWVKIENKGGELKDDEGFISLGTDVFSPDKSHLPFIFSRILRVSADKQWRGIPSLALK